MPTSDFPRRGALVANHDATVRAAAKRLLESEDLGPVSEAHDALTMLHALTVYRPLFLLVDDLITGDYAKSTVAFVRKFAEGMHIVSFGSLAQAPEWAEAHLAQSEIAQLPALLRSLV